MKGDTARNYKLMMISKDCNFITSQKIEGVTDGAEIVWSMIGAAKMMKLDAFMCFVCTYEVPMYDFDAALEDPPAEWSDEEHAAKTLDDLINTVRANLNVED